MLDASNCSVAYSDNAVHQMPHDAIAEFSKLAHIERAQQEAEAECLNLGQESEAHSDGSRQQQELVGELPPIPKLLQLGNNINGTDERKISEM